MEKSLDGVSKTGLFKLKYCFKVLYSNKETLVVGQGQNQKAKKGVSKVGELIIHAVLQP